MLKNNKVLFIISLLISIALWLYVMGTVDPAIDTHINNVKVSITGQEALLEKEMFGHIDGNKTVNVEISGRRSEVNEVRQKGISAVIDISECKAGENQVKVRIELPDGVTGVAVNSISDETVNVLVE